MCISSRCEHAQPIFKIICKENVQCQLSILAFWLHMEYERLVNKLLTFSFHFYLTLRVIRCSPHISCNMTINTLQQNFPLCHSKYSRASEKGLHDEIEFILPSASDLSITWKNKIESLPFKSKIFTLFLCIQTPTI